MKASKIYDLGNDELGGLIQENSLAQQVRAARGDRSQAEVAEAAGVAQQRVAELEAGREPKASTLQRLAVALECTFTISPATDIGQSRPERLSDRAARADRKKRQGTS